MNSNQFSPKHRLLRFLLTTNTSNDNWPLDLPNKRKLSHSLNANFHCVFIGFMISRIFGSGFSIRQRTFRISFRRAIFVSPSESWIISSRGEAKFAIVTEPQKLHQTFSFGELMRIYGVKKWMLSAWRPQKKFRSMLLLLNVRALSNFVSAVSKKNNH